VAARKTECIPDARIGADAPADASVTGRGRVPGVREAVPDRGLARARRPGRGRASLGRARVQPAGRVPACGGAGRDPESSGPRAGGSGGATVVARRRPVHGRGRRLDRGLRPCGRDRRERSQDRAARRVRRYRATWAGYRRPRGSLGRRGRPGRLEPGPDGPRARALQRGAAV